MKKCSHREMRRFKVRNRLTKTTTVVYFCPMCKRTMKGETKERRIKMLESDEV